MTASILRITALISLALGFISFAISRSVAQETEAICCLIAFAVSLSGAGIISKLDELKHAQEGQSLSPETETDRANAALRRQLR